MKKYLLLLLFLPVWLYGQTPYPSSFTFTELPKDLQLYARSGNSATVLVEGVYDRSGSNPDYDRIRLRVNNSTVGNVDLDYGGGSQNTDNFSFSVDIVAELTNYEFEIWARIGTDPWDVITTIVDVVAGDVYIIQGQSNAEASMQSGSVQSGPDDEFIRVYANGTHIDADLLANDNWYEADGNGGRTTNGNAGQWGFKLGQLIVEDQDVPVAIFNGSRGGKKISYFLENADPDGQPTNNYERLLYRLNQTGLENDVQAVFWSQGENTGDADTVNEYKGLFEDLMTSWNADYQNLEQFYIFQTINGCTAYPSLLNKLMNIKEAQRQVAEENNDVQIMSTDGLVQYDEGGANGYCHFEYGNGYEDFANRIYELVDRDFYGGNNPDGIETPMITDAYLTSSTTLVVETSATTLSMGSHLDIFELEGAGGIDIDQNNIQVSGNKIIFELTGYPGSAFITNIGAEPGVENDFITNSRGIEVIAFSRFAFTGDISFPVDDNLMFTQYYEDSSAGNKWLEVKNVSQDIVPANIFYLALYRTNDSDEAPNADLAIPEMDPGEVLLFYRNGNLPTVPNLGSADRINANAVCRFDGNEVILISTSNGTNCYANRIDMLGEFPFTNWGSDTSFIKEDSFDVPDKDFNVNNWVEVEIDDVNDVNDTDANIALGSHNTGNTAWNGSSWTNEAPDQTRSAEISNNYNANDGTLYARDLTITDDVDFDNGTNNSIVVYRDLNISGGGSLTIGDEESLVMYDPNANITGDITKLESSTPRNNYRDFTYWTSSVISSDAQISTVFSGVNLARIFYYDQSQSIATNPAEPTYWDVWQTASGNMLEGVGYAAEGDNDGIHHISFQGEPNNGDLTVPLVFQNPGNDFNLVGNPYPSAIDITAFFADNSDIDGTAYLWTHNTQVSGGTEGDFVALDYASINSMGGTAAGSGGEIPTANIGSGQGFFVNAVSNGSVTFTNDMRIIEANDQFFKSSILSKTSIPVDEKDRIWLNLTSDQGGFSQILLGFKGGLSNKVDQGYDALRFENTGNPISFYSLIDDKKYVIQGKRTFISLRKFTLGFDTNVAPRNFSIGIDKTEGALKNISVFLVDNLLKITHDLSLSDYSFNLNVIGEFPDRFILKFENTSLDEVEEQENNDFKIINGYNGYLAIKSRSKIVKVAVYDLYGNLLIEDNPNSSKFVLNVKDIDIGSILIIAATFENGEIINKKTIRF